MRRGSRSLLAVVVLGALSSPLYAQYYPYPAPAYRPMPMPGYGYPAQPMMMRPPAYPMMPPPAYYPPPGHYPQQRYVPPMPAYPPAAPPRVYNYGPLLDSSANASPGMPMRNAPPAAVPASGVIKTNLPPPKVEAVVEGCGP